jgi:hypothetical protein
VNCMNISYIDIDIVKYHLLLRGISSTYTTWLHHGEVVDASSSNLQTDFIDGDGEIFEDMMTTNEDEDNAEGNCDEFSDMLEDIYFGHLRNDNDTEGNLDAIEVDDVREFDKLLQEARCELYPGCTEYSVLSFIITIMHAKVMFKWSNKSVDYLLKILKKLLPECNERVPWTVYGAKKLLRDLGLGYECIDACKFDCALFWKENASLDKCPVCQTSRYKSGDRNEKKIAHKILRYFPLTPRLKRLYMSRKTATDMRWHHEKRVDDGISRHPADGDEWKNFDRTHLEFARDSRNVRLGLATDGFNPFGNMSISYSMWPIIVTPYNLPPWKCLKEQFCMMSLLIPGPSAPSRNIDVYMRPLIDELKDLWENGVCTYDASSGCDFQMRAAIMWTINDFPAYGNLSGWTTKGYMACPNCNEEHSTHSLRGKIGYMGARRFLPEDHSWRRSKLFDGKVENRPRPRVLTGEQIFEQMSAGTYEPFGKHPSNLKRHKMMSDSNLNWNKQSILFELPYWKTLNLRHNLDVMHIEKNICDSLIGTLLNIKGKSKDTPKARMDLKDMKIRRTLHCKERTDGKIVMPPALYTLSPQERQRFLDFLQSIKYPDGYAANVSKCVKAKDGRLLGLKSHDCHVLLQKILPVGMRGCLSKDICIPLFELGNFFQELCAKTLNTSQFEKMEEQIVLILCKLEKIFPPAFFDVMVHLPIHLPHEAKLGGPVQYRWMYPIER